MSGAGFYGWNHVEALRIAAELPGGVSRTNLMLAVRSLDLDHPYLHDGIAFQMNGLDDPHLIEGSNWARYSAADRAWQEQGVLDLNGTVPPCAWTPGVGCS